MTPSYLKLLSLLSDPTRLRILHVLRKQELSVAELQETLQLGQSRISAHLKQLKTAELVEDRREGQRTYYSWNPEMPNEAKETMSIALKAAAELRSAKRDSDALELVLEKRKEQAEIYFNNLAGRLGKKYCPGRSWEAIAHLLLEMLPKITIADLGAGEGLLSQLMARKAAKVIAIDNSSKMVEVGSQLAEKSGLKNLEYRLGDIESPPLKASSVDLVLMSQALHHAAQPDKALSASYRILKPGGQILILDLNQHDFEKARELYADTWLGFSEVDIRRMLEKAGFRDISTSIATKESETPHFQTLLCSARK